MSLKTCRYKVKGHKNRPKVLEKAKARAARFVEQHLNFFHGVKSVRKRETHSGRNIRTEGRASIAVVAQMLLHYVDAETMAIGWWCNKTGYFISPSNRALLTMLNKGSPVKISRTTFKDVMRMFKKAGYVKYEQERYEVELEDGSKVRKNDIAIKKLSYNLFFELGIKKDEIEALRLHSKNRNNEIRARHGVIGVVANVLESFKGPVRRFFDKKKADRQAKEQKQRAYQKKKQQEARERTGRNYNEQLFELIQLLGRSPTTEERHTTIGLSPAEQARNNSVAKKAGDLMPGVFKA